MNGQQGKNVKEAREPARRAKNRRYLRKSRRGAALLLAGALTTAATSAGADTYRSYSSASAPSSSYYVSAPVVNVSPITSERTIQHPIRQCTRQTYRNDRYERRHREENLFLPGLFGGIVGGLIGNQFGGGSGKKALTIAGAIAGSSIARDAARQHRQHRQHRQQPREVCHTSYQTEVVQSVTAYDVTYEYAGQLFEKRMTEHPGSSVRVRVALEPAISET